MIEGEIRSGQSIVRALSAAQAEVHDFFAAIPDAAFAAANPGEWSPAQNLEHLLKAVGPVALALRLPKIALRLLFGPAKAPSRSFEEIKALYVGKLAAGAQASGRFIPAPAKEEPRRPTPGGSPASRRQHLLREWAGLCATLAARVNRWQERDLDRYRLPHPILGTLTVREMLFFTIYHNQRHATPEGD